MYYLSHSVKDMYAHYKLARTTWKGKCLWCWNLPPNIKKRKSNKYIKSVLHCLTTFNSISKKKKKQPYTEDQNHDTSPVYPMLNIVR